MEKWSILAIWLCCSAGVLHAQCGAPINAFPYLEDFETAPAWTVGGNASDWAWGTPAHPLINTAGGGANSWCVGGLTGSFYNLGQLSFLESPCFDFTNLNFPWISFKIFWECERTYDGLVLQYSLDQGATYQNVGAFNDPVDCLNQNWFNSSNITNITSANPKHGWSGRVGPTVGSCQGGSGSAGWLTATHCMSYLANEPSVRFRFLFGAGTACNSYDGVAIDDVQLQDAPPNVADFSYQCSGNTFSFQDSSTLCPTVHAWDFGDPGSGANNFSSSNSPTHVYPSPGTYNVTYTVSGPCNASSTIVVPVTILGMSLSATPANCGATGSVSATVTGAIGPVNLVWSPGGYTTSTVTGLTPGMYAVTASATNACSVTDSILVGQNASSPVLSATQIDVSCNGLADGSATAIVAGGTAPFSYSWSPNGSSMTTATGLPAGPQTCIVTDANGCMDTLNVTIAEPPLLNLSAPPIVQLCAGAQTTLSATASGGSGSYNYSWAPSGPQVSPPDTTIYQVYVTDTNGCVSDTLDIEVQVTAALQAAFSASDPEGCESHCTDLVAIAPGATNFAWSTGDGSSLNGAIVNHCYQNAGSYDVELTASDANGCSVTVLGPGVVNVLPTPIAGFSANPAQATIDDPLIQFLNNSSGGSVWNWSFGDADNSTSTEYGPTFTYSAVDCYSVQQTVSNSDGCSDQAQLEVCIEDAYTLYAPNAFTPNGDGHNDMFKPITTVRFPSEYELLIFDRWGSLVFRTTDVNEGWNGGVDGQANAVAIGVYVWHLVMRDTDQRKREHSGHVTLVR